MKTPVLYLVVPCYNEEEVLPETSKRLGQKLSSLAEEGIISDKSRVLFVDDGSRDGTWKMISELYQGQGPFEGLKLSRNKGHQNALLAGLNAAVQLCDVCISLDADLQDDIDAIDGMLEKYSEGCHIVYGVRNDRTTDTFFKRGTAQAFYKFMSVMGADVVKDHADYRLMSRRALEELLKFKEVNLFLRGMVPLVGFKSDVVSYKRGERFAGESKYPLKKMIAFALDGITSFSVKPIRFITALGFIIFSLSLLSLVILLVQKLWGQTVQGWTTLMGSVWLLGGLNLLCLGVVGEYIGKIYMEAKGRPPFIVEELLTK